MRVHRAAGHPEHAGLFLLQQPRLQKHWRALHARGQLGDGDGDARAAAQQRVRGEREEADFAARGAADHSLSAGAFDFISLIIS